MENLGGLHSFPVYMGCVTAPASNDLRADMLWHISPSNGLLQLQNLIPLDILYPENHNASIGGIWMKHHKSFASFIREYSPQSVLEIGGAHGILSKIYQDELPSVDWTILEPNPVPIDGLKAKIIRAFFDDQYQLDNDVDAVIHSHVFEHVYDPQSFIRHISRILADGKYLIFSLPNMEEMLKKRYTNCLNFEHTVFLTEPYIEYLLHKHGFRIQDRQYFLDDHSIFYACLRDSTILPTELPSGLYQKNKQIYLDFVSYHHQLAEDLNRQLLTLGPNRKVYLFGAHVFSQFLIGYGLDTTRIECVLDNDPNKQGKRLYGTNLQVESPIVLARTDDPVVILKAGAYNEEIKQDILEVISKNVVFLE
jgi:SAM-dependent methyltransferase